MYVHHSNVSPLPRRAPLIGSKAKASLVVEPHSWGSLLGPSLASLVKLLPPLVGAASYVEPGLGEELSIQDLDNYLGCYFTARDHLVAPWSDSPPGSWTLWTRSLAIHLGL